MTCASTRRENSAVVMLTNLQADLNVAPEVMKCCEVESTFRSATHSILPSLRALLATIKAVDSSSSFCTVEVSMTVSPAIESCLGDRVSYPCRRQLFAVQTGHPWTIDSCEPEPLCEIMERSNSQFVILVTIMRPTKQYQSEFGDLCTW